MQLQTAANKPVLKLLSANTNIGEQTKGHITLQAKNTVVINHSYKG